MNGYQAMRQRMVYTQALLLAVAEIGARVDRLFAKRRRAKA